MRTAAPESCLDDQVIFNRPVFNTHYATPDCFQIEMFGWPTDMQLADYRLALSFQAMI